MQHQIVRGHRWGRTAISDFLGSHCETASPLRLCIIAVGVALSTAAFAETQDFALKDFDGVSVAEGINVQVEVRDAFSVVAESDDPAQLERLELDVRRGTLRASMDSRPFSFRRTKGWKVTVRVSMPKIVHADASSGADLAIDGMDGAILELAASSGAELRVANVTGETINANVSSGARIVSTGGSCRELEAVASSGSYLDLKSVECNAVGINASSGSRAFVFAESSIDANSSSGSTINVFGPHEEIKINSSSGGNIVFP